ncbi:MAG: hypothetical protein AB1529_04995 [Candidatus Micrarchaeota archaeon]
MAERAPAGMDREGAVALLETVGRIPEDVVSLLELPERLYSVGPGPSISSDPSNGIGKVVAYLTFNSSMPMLLPDYGIYISSRGSSTFCTLLDRRRKIIVHDSVGNAFAEGDSWNMFGDSVRAALQAVRRREATGEKFDFIISKESSISTI